ncbi:hypothetical protein PR048_022489 [Dryococelus australis]|uniref:G-patch domain-containing protein n=1 Tax=Dryococelus australis TaxID=614101 RepID=A0ABQ9H146_9NEOP|nr:hypothetical protein PR048_022489 [Dryococelus australis]
MRRGGLRHRPVSPEHSCVVAKHIGNSSRREEVCDASKSRHCQHSRDSKKGRIRRPRAHYSAKREGEVGLQLRRGAAEPAPVRSSAVTQGWRKREIFEKAPPTSGIVRHNPHKRKCRNDHVLCPDGKLLFVDALPRKKPFSLEDQVVRDNQGRRRFHGAFTGGFTAGFFNSVGTLEGWTPSTFKSSRAERASRPTQRPEDFMDDEDMEEFGIAPKVLRAKAEYSERGQKRQKPVSSEGPIPGTPVLQQLLQPVRDTVGVKLLRRMGWKPGQGVGPRLTKHEKRLQRLRQRPGAASSDSSDEEGPEELTFAPGDYDSFVCSPKVDCFGIGYSGLDRRPVLSGHVNLFDGPSLVMSEKSRKVSIRGQGNLLHLSFCCEGARVLAQGRRPLPAPVTMEEPADVDAPASSGGSATFQRPSTSSTATNKVLEVLQLQSLPPLQASTSSSGGSSMSSQESCRRQSNLPQPLPTTLPLQESLVTLCECIVWAWSVGMSARSQGAQAESLFAALPAVRMATTPSSFLLALWDGGPLNSGQHRAGCGGVVLVLFAFGVGALEEDDEDIYSREDMSQYDFALDVPSSSDQPSKVRAAASGPSSGVLEGFVAAVTKQLARVARFPPPTLPTDYQPSHHPHTSRFEPTTGPEPVRRRVGTADRAVMVGEEQGESKEQERQHLAEAAARLTESLPAVGSGQFRPFAAQPDKQRRYEQFLTLVKLGETASPYALGRQYRHTAERSERPRRYHEHKRVVLPPHALQADFTGAYHTSHSGLAVHSRGTLYKEVHGRGWEFISSISPQHFLCGGSLLTTRPSLSSPRTSSSPVAAATSYQKLLPPLGIDATRSFVYLKT